MTQPEVIRAFVYMGHQVQVEVHRFESRFHWIYVIDGIEHHELNQLGWPDCETAFLKGEDDATREIHRRNWRERAEQAGELPSV